MLTFLRKYYLPKEAGRRKGVSIVYSRLVSIVANKDGNKVFMFEELSGMNHFKIMIAGKKNEKDCSFP